jgi:acetyl-CoA acyltransferase
MQAIADAAKSISYGQPHLILAGGVECLSNTPITYSKKAQKFLIKLSKTKTLGQKLSLLREFSWTDWLPRQPELAEPLTGYTMGQHAEMMAKINGITREEQDQFAYHSHQQASRAQKKGILAEEIVAVWPAPRHKDCVELDNLIREDTSVESLRKLKPAFDRKTGSITAGSSSALTDGAAITLIGDEDRARSLGLKPKALIKDVCFVGVQPFPQLLIGPAIAIPLLLRRQGLTLNDIDRFEVHEAFAAQVLSCLKMLDSKEFAEKHLGTSKPCGIIPPEKLNVNGGAIAIGHPFGATGARLATSLANELIRSDTRLGLIAICAAGGVAGAMLLERID